MRKVIPATIALAFAVVIAAYALSPISTRQIADQVQQDGKVYITDQTGEKWDITQAVGLGFEARRFQYGIGRWAFTTLDDSDLSEDTTGASGRTRIIGVKGNAENQAYSVRKLSRHELANTNIDGKPIAVGY